MIQNFIDLKSGCSIRVLHNLPSIHQNATVGYSTVHNICSNMFVLYRISTVLFITPVLVQVVSLPFPKNYVCPVYVSIFIVYLPYKILLVPVTFLSSYQSLSLYLIQVYMKHTGGMDSNINVASAAKFATSE